MQQWWKPGQVAERAGVAVSTLHYYESIGLISSRRTAGNRREYRRDVLRVLAFVRAAQSVGVSLDAIKEAVATLPDARPPTPQDWARLSAGWRDDLDLRIDRLIALRDRFDQCIGCGCLSLTACPIANAEDRLGAEGPGARRLP